MLTYHTPQGAKTELQDGDTIVWFRESHKLQVFRGTVTVTNGVASAEPLRCSNREDHRDIRDFISLMVGESESFMDTVRKGIEALAANAALGIGWLPDEPTHFICVLTKDKPC